MDTVDLGASIACSGACLTVVDKGVTTTVPAVDLSADDERRTTAHRAWEWRGGRGSTSSAR